VQPSVPQSLINPDFGLPENTTGLRFEVQADFVRVSSTKSKETPRISDSAEKTARNTMDEVLAMARSYESASSDDKDAPRDVEEHAPIYQPLRKEEIVKEISSKHFKLTPPGKATTSGAQNETAAHHFQPPTESRVNARTDSGARAEGITGQRAQSFKQSNLHQTEEQHLSVVERSKSDGVGSAHSLDRDKSSQPGLSEPQSACSSFTNFEAVSSREPSSPSSARGLQVERRAEVNGRKSPSRQKLDSPPQSYPSNIESYERSSSSPRAGGLSSNEFDTGNDSGRDHERRHNRAINHLRREMQEFQFSVQLEMQEVRAALSDISGKLSALAPVSQQVRDIHDEMMPTGSTLKQRLQVYGYKTAHETAKQAKPEIFPVFLQGAGRQGSDSSKSTLHPVRLLPPSFA